MRIHQQICVFMNLRNCLQSLGITYPRSIKQMMGGSQVTRIDLKMTLCAKYLHDIF